MKLKRSFSFQRRKHEFSEYPDNKKKKNARLTKTAVEDGFHRRPSNSPDFVQNHQGQISH